MHTGAAPDYNGDPITAAAKQTLRNLASWHQVLTTEITELDTELRWLCEQTNLALLDACGIAPETAAALLIAASENSHRTRNEASVAVLCGTSPVEAAARSSVRHRKR